jgi:predicted RNA-binding Zn ribbon-like protein
VRRPPRYDVPKKAPGSLLLAQEFLNTRDKEHDREWLDTPDAVRRWFGDRGIVTGRLSGADAQLTRDVREAMREVVASGGAQAGGRAVRLLNDVADKTCVTIRFDAVGPPQLDASARGISGALGRVLLVAVVANLDGRWNRLKTCRNCSWAFYDYSRNCSAKWCSMTLCGNRLKTRSYYRRRRT